MKRSIRVKIALQGMGIVPVDLAVGTRRNRNIILRRHLRNQLLQLFVPILPGCFHAKDMDGILLVHEDDIRQRQHFLVVRLGKIVAVRAP